ncbi:MAG: MmcQ/YjbR family DNA-binding protein [Clostridia bacterium]|nr:MmcQ/YjbR family DNA-binding protein [Clostridia bacterium]
MQLNGKMITEYCLAKKGALEDFPFGPDVLVLKVASKMFALISERRNRLNISLKCDPFLAQDLRQRFPSIEPGYHLNKKHWITVVVDGTIPDHEIYWMIDHSYELVLKGLTKQERESL